MLDPKIEVVPAGYDMDLNSAYAVHGSMLDPEIYNTIGLTLKHLQK